MPFRIQLTVWFVKVKLAYRSKLILFCRLGILISWKTNTPSPNFLVALTWK